MKPVDNSILSSVARCSTEAVLRHVHGLTSSEERATLRSGSAAHEALATYLMTGDADKALATFTTEYMDWAEKNVANDDRLSFANLTRVMSAWFAANPIASLPFKVEVTEIGFTYPLADPASCRCACANDKPAPFADTDEDLAAWEAATAKAAASCSCDCHLVFCGRIDAIATAEHDRATYIVEHKTTGQISSTWLRGFRMDSQLSGYTWAAQQHLGRPVVGAVLNAIEFSKLPVSDRKCKDHGVSHSECYPAHLRSQFAVIQRTPEELARWRKDALHLARRYRDLAQRFGDLSRLHGVATQGKWNRSCAWCFSNDFCSVGRPVDNIPQMFVEDRWDPLARAQGPALPTEPAPEVP